MAGFRHHPARVRQSHRPEGPEYLGSVRLRRAAAGHQQLTRTLRSARGLRSVGSTSTLSRRPGKFEIGSAPRYLPNIRIDGTTNADIALMKNFQVREAVRIQFRAEAFNLANTPQFGMPSTGGPGDGWLGCVRNRARHVRQRCPVASVWVEGLLLTSPQAHVSGVAGEPACTRLDAPVVHGSPHACGRGERARACEHAAGPPARPLLAIGLVWRAV